MPTAKKLPRATSHQGERGGSASASNTAVTTAL